MSEQPGADEQHGRAERRWDDDDAAADGDVSSSYGTAAAPIAVADAPMDEEEEEEEMEELGEAEQQRLRDELDTMLRGDDSDDPQRGHELWRKFETVTASAARELCEKVRMILEP